MLDLELLPSVSPNSEESIQDYSKTVVRVSTSYWSDDRGMYSRKSIKYLKRNCHGFNFMTEEIFNVGAEDAWKILTNIDQIDDGIYELVPTFLGGYDYYGEYDGYVEFKLIKNEI